MLSALEQGSVVHIIDKSNGIKYFVGEIINKTEPVADYTNPTLSIAPPTFFNLSVKVGEETYELKHLNASISVANNGNIIVSETKEGLTPTVESILHTSKKAIDPETIDYHTKAVADCEDILKKLNPVFAREKERDSRIQTLEDTVGGMNDKLDKILNFINSK